ncbi:type II toxin-antitoxin system prevent-host-death family antitoxin [Roseibium aggregatum]|uniref:Prevent-host-death family protein n=1 Tax=Roseibium aggregatum TaxID=187304 RepID=A0A0M6YE31_9HYPH|nr:type II toxin-antitoxin system prevent-host-death family antitoxin [Roseibium aggregatum]CTQ47699.1 prevent-host-death family protein [Roseibium aggregatum]
MKEFSYSDLARKSGEVLDVAAREGVSLVKHGREMLVIIPRDHYDDLRRGDARSVFSMADAPDDLLDELAAGISESRAELAERMKDEDEAAQ